METYRAAYRWTSEELIRSLQRHEQLQLGLAGVLAVILGSIPLARCALWILRPGPIAGALLLLAGALAVWAVLMARKAQYWWVSRAFASRRDANRMVEWEFSPHGVRRRCVGLESSDSAWSVFVRLAEAPDGFMFYPSRNMFYWLPFSAFESARGIEDVRRLAEANKIPRTVLSHKYLPLLKFRAPL